MYLSGVVRKMLTSRLLFIIFLLASCGVWAGYPEIPADKEVISIPSKLGTVTFAHKAHSGLKNVDCKTCHHSYPDVDGIQDCHNCHKPKASDTIKAKEAFHTRCRGCHKYTVDSGEKGGPTRKCELCHQ